MNNIEALVARVAVLENYVVVLATMVAIQEGKPVEEIVHIYNSAHSIAVKRYNDAQPGPEKTMAKKAMYATHAWFERLKAFLHEK